LFDLVVVSLMRFCALTVHATGNSAVY
jgi:hypothetical protein